VNDTDFYKLLQLSSDHMKRVNPVPCMSLYVCEESSSVEFVASHNRPTYSDQAMRCGGGDCGVIVDRETEKIIGVRLPLYHHELVVSIGKSNTTFHAPVTYQACEQCGIETPHVYVSARGVECEYCRSMGEQ